MKKALIAAIVLLGCNLPDPQIGEVWRYTISNPSNRNPFRSGYEMKPYYDFKVINIRDGWVQYIDVNDSIVGSLSISGFKLGAKPINK